MLLVMYFILFVAFRPTIIALLNDVVIWPSVGTALRLVAF